MTVVDKYRSDPVKCQILEAIRIQQVSTARMINEQQIRVELGEDPTCADRNWRHMTAYLTWNSRKIRHRSATKLKSCVRPVLYGVFLPSRIQLFRPGVLSSTKTPRLNPATELSATFYLRRERCQIELRKCDVGLDANVFAMSNSNNLMPLHGLATTLHCIAFIPQPW